MALALPELIERWNSGDGKPYKGSLIDWRSFRAQPDNIGCMCAQGQALHLLGGWSPQKLRDTAQDDADRETAKLLGISVAHAILLRNVNDSVDGAPSIVLTNPEKVLGDQAHIVLAFWRHLDRMTDEQWKAARGAARDAAWVAAWVAARVAAWDAARVAAWDAARDAARDAAWVAAWDAAWFAAWVAAWVAAGDAVGDAAGDAAGNACAEIQGARLLREQGKPFFFLPMFGFADPEAVLAADEATRGDVM